MIFKDEILTYPTSPTEEEARRAEVEEEGREDSI